MTDIELEGMPPAATLVRHKYKTVSFDEHIAPDALARLRIGDEALASHKYELVSIQELPKNAGKPRFVMTWQEVAE